MPSYRIMIVDDEDDIRMIVKSILAKKYEVVEANDGLDALEKLERYEPDFIVMDVMMPLMDGFKACEAIRRHPVYEAMPVLFLSALNTRDDMKKGYSAGGNLYLTKPFDPQRLLKNIDVFFETTPPALRKKSWTLEQLAEQDAARAAAPKPTASAIVGQAALQQRPGTRRLAADDTQETLPESNQSTSKEGRPRLMVVDDDEDLVKVIDAGVARQFEVTWAYDGIEAIEKIVQYEPDLIMIDALMPRMSGYQLCQSLRRNKRFTETPIVFVSGKSSPKDVAYAKRIGGNDFVAKPFELGDLRDKLVAMTRQPGFVQHRKRLSIHDIRQREELFAKERARRERDRNMRASGVVEKKPEGELEAFVRKLTEENPAVE